jgi:hypothetical protein
MANNKITEIAAYGKGFSDGVQAALDGLKGFNMWREVRLETPPDNKLVLCYCPDEPINKIVVAAWDQDHNCFVDNDDYSYGPTHWAYIPDLPAILVDEE